MVETSARADHLARVDTVAMEAGMSVRALQRLFAEHVGIGPKWVIRYHRLNELRNRLDRGAPVNWAELATELGHADQAHLTGTPPRCSAHHRPGTPGRTRPSRGPSH